MSSNKPHGQAGKTTPRPIHHSPMFWIGAVMFLLAIVIYVLSDDLSMRLGFR